MFGIGAQEMVLIGLLALVIFGPGRLRGIARDLGRFVHKARASVEDFKSEFAFEEEPNHGKFRRNREFAGNLEAARGREPEEPEKNFEPEEDRGLKDVRHRIGDRGPEHSAKECPEEADITPKS